MITYWPSPAKINLFLYITGKREDGYYSLQTLFQLLNYGDIIGIEPRLDGKLNLVTSIFGIKKEDNLILHAAKLLMKEAILTNRLSKKEGANFYLKKRIPIGSGLGGGSSNAATTLVALNHMWGSGFSKEELAMLGSTLGADVPFFIHGRSAFAEGKGDLLFSLDLEEKWYLLSYPKINISTSKMFKNLNISYFTSKKPRETLLKCEFSNVFEHIVKQRFFKVSIALSWLLKHAPSRLTGTGSCIFSEFESKSSALKVLEKAPSWLFCFIAQGVNLSPLEKIIFIRSS